MLEKIDRILLASASPRRLELLRTLGVEVTVIPSAYHEVPIEGMLPIELAMRHAKEKLSGAISGTPPEKTVVVAADTVVDVDGIAFGKPRDVQDAKRMLTCLSGREHAVHTAFAVALPVPQASGLTVKVETTTVRFHNLSRTEIDDYVATGEPMDKAGSYGIQGFAAALIDRINGDFYTVMGFPLGPFIRTLHDLGYVFR